jgi:hypothetical protein
MAEEEKDQQEERAKHADIQRRKQANAEEIDDLRERLYSRGGPTTKSTRHSLVDRERQSSQKEPAQKQNNQQAPIPEEKPISETAITNQSEVDAVVNSESMPKQNRRSSFRKAIVIFGTVFFVVAIGIASAFLFWGNNNFSGNNISIHTTGPVSVGGGEEMDFQIAISNHNTVPIKFATLYVEYPKGTKSASEDGKELSLEKIQLDTIDSGELVNIPLKAVIYGEEDEEQEIKARIEYRVEGSNATFEKKADPLMFEISTSPIVLTVDAVDTISSGQEYTMTLTLQSNSPTPLSNILVKASYPIGFDFVESDPDTVSGQDTWSLDTLDPNEKQTISITGLVTGGENEAKTFDITAGVSSDRDVTTLVSQLATTRTEVIIEEPFLDVEMKINNSLKDTVIIDENDRANVNIKFTNTLDTALFDGKVQVELGGNALNEYRVDDFSGFYDSLTNTITWDRNSEPSLVEILPGRSVNVTFRLDPSRNIGNAPELTFKVTFSGQRQVFSSELPQNLQGIVERKVRIESVSEVASETLYSSGPFTNTGPTPPVAETVTQYAYVIEVESGVNDVTDAELTAVLPQYVSWLDLYQGEGSVTFNSTSRTMKWEIGDMDSHSSERLYVQISMRPSLSQVGSTPTLVGTQRFKATDRFTGTTIRANGSALTTSNDNDDVLEDGRVRNPE